MHPFYEAIDGLIILSGSFNLLYNKLARRAVPPEAKKAGLEAPASGPAQKTAWTKAIGYAASLLAPGSQAPLGPT